MYTPVLECSSNCESIEEDSKTGVYKDGETELQIYEWIKIYRLT